MICAYDIRNTNEGYIQGNNQDDRPSMSVPCLIILVFETYFSRI